MPRAFLIKKHSSSSSTSSSVAPRVLMTLKRPWPDDSGLGSEVETENAVTNPISLDLVTDTRGPYDLSVKTKKQFDSETVAVEVKPPIIMSPQPKVVTPPLAIALIDPKISSPDHPVKPGAPLEPLNPNTPHTPLSSRSAWHRPVLPPYLPFNYPFYPFPRHASELYGPTAGYLNGSTLVPPPLVPLSPPRSTSLQLSPCMPQRDGGSPNSLYCGKQSPPIPPKQPMIMDHLHKDSLYPPWIPNGKDLSTSPTPSSDSDSGKDINGKRRQVPRYQCSDCHKSYSTYSGLSKHRQFHCVTQAKKSFSCKYCEKVYISLGALKMHIRTHTLPCKCKLCGKAFSRPWLLQGHIRTHTGEKPFACPHCSRAFADRSNLRAHLQTHSDVKKYNCKACSKTFSRMSLLLKHSDGGCSGIQPR